DAGLGAALHHRHQPRTYYSVVPRLHERNRPRTQRGGREQSSQQSRQNLPVHRDMGQRRWHREERLMMTSVLPSEAVTSAPPKSGHCRFCGAPLAHTFVDLGMSPPCNNILKLHQLNEMEAFYPLHAWVCDQCFLVQLQEYVSPGAIFSDYSYFSSYSDSWLRPAQDYVALATGRFGLDGDSHVVEIASNHGYLLQYFVQGGVPVLGVEPAANVAEVAAAKGIPTVVKFFGRNTAHDL